MGIDLPKILAILPIGVIRRESSIENFITLDKNDSKSNQICLDRHDEYTFSNEDRQDLLGHRSSRITTHYSTAELQSLYAASGKVYEKQQSGMVITLLRTVNHGASALKQDRKVVML